jgi:hypothetical protein
MMAPTVTRAELNEADDIISESGVTRLREMKGKTFGTPKSQCEGKQAFDVRSLADTAARRMPGREAYRCRYCRKWHVGGKANK